MQKNIIFMAVAIVLVTVITGIVIEPAAAGIVFIVAATLLLSYAIYIDAGTHTHPELFASLADDARTIRLENLGTAPAKAVRVKIIPDDFGYDAGDLVQDTTHTYELPGMVREAKAAVSWEKKDGTRAEKIFRLSGYADDTDPLRPVFPLFGWKEK